MAVTKTCLQCTKEFRVIEALAIRKKFCTKECQIAHREASRVTRPCEHCGKEFTSPASLGHLKYCNQGCYDAARNAKPLSEKKDREYPKCANCGGPRSFGGKSDYCRECFYKLYREERGGYPKCQTCGQDIVSVGTGVLRRKFCSKKCYGDSRLSAPRVIPCEVCGKEFERALLGGAIRKTCSHECMRELMSRSAGGRFKENCETCGAEFETIKSRHKKYCSLKCYAQSRTVDKEEKACEFCGGIYEVRVGSEVGEARRFCSMSCSAKFRADNTGKSRPCLDGHNVRSNGEMLIDNWLSENRLFHVYDPPAPLGKADWLVGDTFIEFWGIVGNEKYDEGRQAKLAAYAAAGAKVIEIFPEDLPNLEAKLAILKR